MIDTAGSPIRRRVIFLNRDDMKTLGFGKEEWVDLISHFEGETRRAKRFKVVPCGLSRSYFPKTNALVPLRNVADRSNQPASKSIVISLEMRVCHRSELCGLFPADADRAQVRRKRTKRAGGGVGE
jgi:anaerobic selenocysteine-containing dehydrogenase